MPRRHTYLTTGELMVYHLASGTLGYGCGPGQRLTVPGMPSRHPRPQSSNWVSPSPSPSSSSSPIPVSAAHRSPPRRPDRAASRTVPPPSESGGAEGERRPRRPGRRGSSRFEPAGPPDTKCPRPDREGSASSAPHGSTASPCARRRVVPNAATGSPLPHVPSQTREQGARGGGHRKRRAWYTSRSRVVGQREPRPRAFVCSGAWWQSGPGPALGGRPPESSGRATPRGRVPAVRSGRAAPDSSNR